MKNLDEKKWDTIRLTDVFDDTISRGKRIKKKDHVFGKTPYVSSTASSNGNDGTCGNDINVRKFSDCLTLANSGSVGACFYHPYRFVASDHVTALKRNGMDENGYLALSVLCGRIGEKYNFNREINDFRISRERIMIPITESGKPDYDYISKCVQVHKNKMLERYETYIAGKISTMECSVIPGLNEKQWAPFPIVDIFQSFAPGKGKGLNHLTQVEAGGVNYIGATNRGNGVMCFVKKDPESQKLIQKGNCIGFIKNGDGAAGYAIYKAEPFISTSDVIYGYADWLNRYTGLFFVASQDLIEDKYSHGYKRNKEHLRGDRVMLPVDDSGNPDYQYMEQYAKNMMLRKYKQYLAYQKAKEAESTGAKTE